MALTVGELAATITVDDSGVRDGVNNSERLMRAGGNRIVDTSQQAGQDAGQALGDGLADGGAEGGAGAADAIKGALKSLAAATIGASIGAALGAAMGQAIEQEKIGDRLGAQLGATPEQAKRYGQIAGQLYANAVTEDVQGAADAIKAVMGAGLLPPDATNAQIEQLSTKVSDLAGTFDQDLGGVTNAVSQMLRTGLAKNADEAFDILTAGFQSSANKADDLVDTFNEYGTQFRKAGIDGATAVGLMNQAIQAGARDSDIAADAIKEFSIRAVDGSATTAQGFQALGLNATDMAAKFGKGGKSASAALDTTLDRLRAIKDPVKQSAAATALFGTQAEDLGAALFAMDPSSAAKGLGQVGGAADKMGKSLRDNASTRIEQFKRGLQQGIVDIIGSKVLPALESMINFLGQHSTEIKAAALVLTAVLLPAMIRTAATSAASAATVVASWIAMGFQSMVQAARMAAAWLIAMGPVGLIIAAVVALVALIIANWDTIVEWTTKAWDWIWNKIKAVGDFILNLWMKYSLPGIIISHWKAIQDGTVRVWNAVVNWLRGVPGKLVNLFLNWTLPGLIIKHWQSIKDGSIRKANELVKWVRGLPAMISRGIGSLGSLLYSKGQSVVTGLWSGIRSMGGWLKSTLTSWALSIIPGPIARALGIHSPSRVLADQVGHWIPAGIAQGAEDNAGVIDRTMRNLVDVPTPGMTTARMSAASVGAAGSSGSAAGRLVIDVTGADGDFKRMIRRMVRIDGRGSVQLAFG
ncbi:phage tail tape measure protein [Streptomyces sp. NPDC026673]|uniref:phage tail tape measure protein n=1 Tax=Streptomyces sp. NPDC026673 TaxID=3155724 RepID=UPI0033C2D571